jgi:hypothetical protein
MEEMTKEKELLFLNKRIQKELLKEKNEESLFLKFFLNLKKIRYMIYSILFILFSIFIYIQPNIYLPNNVNKNIENNSK